jgi:hypothetical protein
VFEATGLDFEAMGLVFDASEDACLAVRAASGREENASGAPGDGFLGPGSVVAEVAPVRAAIQSVLQGRYGKGSSKLLAYGFTPQKVAERTVASKAGAIVKNEATRTARGTKGSKKKLEITGGVTGVKITPVTSTPNAAPVATPAPEPAPAPAGKPPTA